MGKKQIVVKSRLCFAIPVPNCRAYIETKAVSPLVSAIIPSSQGREMTL